VRVQGHFLKWVENFLNRAISLSEGLYHRLRETLGEGFESLRHLANMDKFRFLHRHSDIFGASFAVMQKCDVHSLLGIPLQAEQSLNKRERRLDFWTLQILAWGALGVILPGAKVAGVLPDVMPTSGIYFFVLLGFLLTSAIRPLCRKIFYRHYPLAGMVLILGLLALGALALFELLSFLFCFLCFGDAFFYTRPFRGGSVINHFLILSSWLALYFLLKQKRLTRLLERENRESALRLLRYQVSPHFLFNALNSIAAHADNPQKVTLGIESLADYLRFSMNQNRMTHPLGEELEAMENYLTVEKIRFEAGLDFKIEADASVRLQETPPSIVQPLVENAIKYGVPTASGALEIFISATANAKRLRVMVENSGSWIPEHSHPSSSTGLANLRNRLQAIYGDRADLAIVQGNECVRIVLSIPIP
jgi:hypothetical protein